MRVRTIFLLLATIAMNACGIARGQHDFSKLEDYESNAITNNPALEKIQLRMQAANSRANQLLRRQNPTVGIFGEEVGNDDEAIIGAFWQQNFRLGGKRYIDHEVKSRESLVLAMQYEQQLLRIKTDVRTAFYNLLISQRRWELSGQLRDAQKQATELIKERFDSGEAPQIDYFQAKLRADQSSIQTRQNEIAIEGAWRELASLIGIPSLELRTVDGSLDNVPELIEWETVAHELVLNSPEILAAQEKIRHADALYRQACAYGVPDLQTQVQVGHDTATDDVFGGLQVGMPLQIFNRNEGNISAAQCDVEAARKELTRVELALQKRLAPEYRDYRQSWEQTNVYTEELIPTARKTLDLVTEGYREGETSILQLLTAQQTMIDMTFQYLDNLQRLWNSHQKIHGLLLSGSLEE